MRIIDTDALTKEIHFPIARAVYKAAPKRNWFQKIIKFFTYRRWFEIVKDYIIWVPMLETYIFLPASFLSDGASVPKIFNSIFNTNGMLLLGSYPHDFGYRYECLVLVDEMTGALHVKSFTKSELDEIFESLCAWESGFDTASRVAKYVLSLFGFLGWYENRRKCCDLKTDFPSLFAEIQL